MPLWLLIVLIIIAILVVIGIAAYCGSGIALDIGELIGDMID